MSTKPIKLGDMHWYCKEYDCNANVIKDINVLRYREEDIKKMKKKSTTKEEFTELLKREMMWQYWSRCEYELIIELADDGNIWLKPWVGCRNPEEVKVNVMDDMSFDWKGFAEYHINKQIYKNKAKVDVFDQLQYRWNDFIDYCWNFHHKWQRRKTNDVKNIPGTL